MTLLLEPESTIGVAPGRTLLLDVGATVPADLNSKVEMSAMCVLIDVNGKACYSVFDRDHQTPDNAVQYMGYSPGATGPNQGERFSLRLDALHSQIAATYVALSAQPACQFDETQETFLDLYYHDINQVESISQYKMPAAPGSCGILLMRFFRTPEGWLAQALRSEIDLESSGELADKAAEYHNWYPAV